MKTNNYFIHMLQNYLNLLQWQAAARWW